MFFCTVEVVDVHFKAFAWSEFTIFGVLAKVQKIQKMGNPKLPVSGTPRHVHRMLLTNMSEISIIKLPVPTPASQVSLSSLFIRAGASWGNFAVYMATKT